MPDPLHERDQVAPALRAAAAAAERYLATIDSDLVRRRGADAAAMSLRATFPEDGDGALVAIDELVRASDGALRASGPRFFHWVIGGTTPAALAADWLTSAFDQNAAAYDSTPLGTRCEEIAIDWLKDLFGLPESWGGVLTTGATMANYTALAAARRWWAQQHGVDVDARGFAGLPAVPVLSSGYIHPSATKALAMLGIGRDTVRRFSRDDVGRIDLAALEAALRSLNGDPAVIVGNAGEVNAGDFDPIERLADLAERYGAWLHVDGAFGLFARVTPRAAYLAAGVERAHSVIADAHKWLNVAYDSGLRSCATRRCSVRHSRSALRISRNRASTHCSAVADPRPRGGRAVSRSGRRCGPTGAPATARWSSGTSISRSVSRARSTPRLISSASPMVR